MTKRPSASAAPTMAEPLEAFEEPELEEHPVPDELEYKESTIFWHPEGELETPLAVLWVNTHYPHSRAMVVSELLIPRLNELNHVIILSRPNARRAPLIRITRNETTGQQFHDVVDPRERLDSVKASPVIPLAPFISGASRYSIGKFNSDRFFDVCAQYMTGTMRIQAKEMTIRYIPG